MRRRRLPDVARPRPSARQRQPAPSQPPAGGGKSQGPAHGQGIGIGLFLLSTGAHGGGGVTQLPQPFYVASATTPRPGANVGTLAVNLPTYAANDHVLINLCGDFLLTGDTATAAGWTQDGRQATGPNIIFAFHRKMVGNEGATVTFTFPNSFERPWAIAASYRGAAGLETSVVQGQNSPVSSWSLGSVATTGPSRKIVALVFSASAFVGTDFTTVNGVAAKRVDVTEATSPNGFAEAALIADLGAAAGGNYSMGGAFSQVTTWLGVLIALTPTT